MGVLRQSRMPRPVAAAVAAAVASTTATPVTASYTSVSTVCTSHATPAKTTTVATTPAAKLAGMERAVPAVWRHQRQCDAFGRLSMQSSRTSR